MKLPHPRFSRLAALAVLLLSLAGACSTELDASGEVGTATDDDLVFLAAGSISRHALVSNAQVIGVGGVTRQDIQAFLEFHGSALSSYHEGGKSAARWIHEAAVASSISPIYLLARIETESGLIRSGTLVHLNAATGCGCPDGATCNPNLAGFGLQVRCAAEKMRGYIRSLDTLGQTISGWRVGTGKSTLDPCWVIPQNRATAALYTYTPWVGAYAAGCGTSQWGGSSLVALLTRRFADDMAAIRDPASTDFETIVVDNRNSNNDSSVAEASLSASWATSSSTSGFAGQDYRFAGLAPISDAAVFSFYVDAPGRYAIDLRWTAGANRCASCPVLIEDAEGVRVGDVRVDQRSHGGAWNALGRFDLAAGWNEVLLSRWAGGTGVVIADAVRIRR